MNPNVRPIAFDEQLFAPMLQEALAGDGPFMARLADEWRRGVLRFEEEGEVLFGAFEEDSLIGVGGISRDPYKAAAGLGRVRHLYVMQSHRQRGWARLLVQALLEHAACHFRTLRLRTGDQRGAAIRSRWLCTRRRPGTDPRVGHKRERFQRAFIGSARHRRMAVAQTLIITAVLALAAPALAQEPPERTTTAVVYGEEACPKPSDEEEIVVCARRPERERYRIPKELRGKGEPLSETAWGSRNELLEEAARVNLPGSCSTVGSYGQSGCHRQFVDQWFKEMRGKRAR